MALGSGVEPLNPVSETRCRIRRAKHGLRGRSRTSASRLRRPAASSAGPKIGLPGRTRTYNIEDRSLVLFQLSYGQIGIGRNSRTECYGLETEVLLLNHARSGHTKAPLKKGFVVRDLCSPESSCRWGATNTSDKSTVFLFPCAAFGPSYVLRHDQRTDCHFLHGTMYRLRPVDQTLSNLAVPQRWKSS